MTRDHFSKVMHSPYFQSEHYAHESAGGKIERKLESWFRRFFKKEKKSK